MPPFNTKHLLREFDSLVFARVTSTKVVPPKEGEPVPKDPFFFGFAVRVDLVDEKKQNTIWFKKNTHVTSRGGFFAVGVSHVPACDVPPERGDIVVGKITETKKGPMFQWWTHKARPFLEFVRTVRRGPRVFRNPSKAYALLKLEHTREHTTDDLYVVARLLLLRDVNSLISSLYEYEQRPRHPQKKDESGHQRQRGFDCEFRPVEVAYFVSQFCANKHILEACIAHLNKHSDKIQNWPHQDMTDYTPERLQSFLEEKRQLVQ